jgi:[ribosomal protein S18]-alanine N-acetyltransferase
MKLRDFRRDDVAAISTILEQSPDAAQWGREALTEPGPGQVTVIAEIDGEIAGFIAVRVIADEMEILNLAVHPQYRRHHLGQALLNAIENKGSTRGVKQIFLEVRESNVTGISFYLALGFRQTGMRPQYYRNPTENAILMSKILTA